MKEKLFLVLLIFSIALILSIGSVSATNITVDQVANASGTVKSSIESNKALPSNININGTQLNMAQFLEVSTVAVLNIHNNTNGTISVKSVSVPTAPSENISGGTINATEYLDIAHRVNSFIATNGVAPNFASTSLGNMRYQSLVYAYSRILYSYDVNKELPDYITVDSWSVVSSSSTTFYNEDQINDAASRVKSFIETNRQLPNFVTISGRQVNMPSFLKLVTTSLLNVAGNFYTSTACKNYGSAPSPSENIINKNMGYSEYITVASNIQTFMYTMGHAPNYASTSFGNVRFQSLIYTYSKLLHHYNSTYNLPSNVTVDPWSVISNPNTAYFTIDQVINASGTVKSSIETNHSLPSTITIAGKQINMRQYLQLATEALLTLRGDLCTSFIPRNYGTATNPSENMTDKYIIYDEYFDIARRVNSFMDTNRIAPNYAIQHSTGETIRYESLVYIYSQILNSYKETDYMPLYINFYPWGKVSNTSTVFFNKNQIIDAAEIVTSYVEANQILPGSVTINGHSIHMTQYLHLQTTMLLNIARDLNSSIIWDKSIDKFYMSQENIVSGTMNTDEYLILAKEVKKYINSNGFVPDYKSFTSLGIQIGCPSLMYMFSQVMNFYKNNNETLPDYITVTPWVALSNPNSIYNYESNKIFSSIQDAIDDEDTMHGSTIGIGVSSISENIVINKKLTITNVPGVNVTVQAADPNLPVFTITTEGSGSIIHNISINGSTNNIGIFINNSYYNLILENNIESNLNGVFLNNSSYNEIVENNISNNTMNGILIENDSEDNTIAGNKIGYNTINGIKINSSNNNIISNNIVLNNYVDGIYLNNASNLINFNRIVGNNRYGLYNEGNGTVDAQNNWWGSNNPNISLNSTSDIGINGGIVNCDQWLVLNINSSTDRSNRTSTTYNQIITADLTHNNLGKDTSDDRGAFPDNTVPDGIPINFSTTLGTIDSSVNIKRGKSVAILNSSIAGSANVSVTLDNQTISLPINLTSTNTLGIYNNRTGQGFNTIQDAINNVNTLNGDIITLAEGIYTENIVVYKRITIQPVIGANVTVQAADPFKGVISILANGSIIRNLNIIGAADSYAVSSHGNNIKLIENIISKNKYGIYLLNANNNILSGNILTNNVHGISLFNSISNTVSGNNITNNWYGIQFSYSNNNTVSGNNITNNWYGSEFSYSNNNTVSGNNITDNNMGISLNYSNNTVSGNNITENAVGISYYESNNALTSGNNIEYNWLKDISHLDTTGIILQTNIFSCGPASLATVMNNMGINTTELEIINLAGIDLSGTSMYGLVHAAQFKGLNATGMILSSDELSIDNIVLLSIAGFNHYSVIKSINDTTVLLADSAFGNIEMTREEFNELFSGYVLIVTNNSTNNTLNGTILTNEQMQNIKGTNIAYVAGGALILAGPVGWTILAGALTGIVIYNHLIDPYLKRPKITTTTTQQNRQNYPVVRSPTINSYTRARSPGNKYTPTGYVSRNGYVSTSNIRPVDLEYQRNYEKYLNKKAAELAKISGSIQDQRRADYGLKDINRYKQGPPKGDDGDEATFLLNLYKMSVKKINSGIAKLKAGDAVGGAADITLGTGGVYVWGSYIIDTIWPEGAWPKN